MIHNTFYLVYFPFKKEFLSDSDKDGFMAVSPDQAMKIRTIDNAKKLATSFRYNSLKEDFIIYESVKMGHKFDMTQVFISKE